MKAEIQELIDEMADIMICALDVPKYTNQTQLENTIEGLKDLALEVMDSPNQIGTPFSVIMVTMN